MLSWKVWVTVLIRDEELDYFQVTIPCCTMKKCAVPFVLEITYKFSKRDVFSYF